MEGETDSRGIPLKARVGIAVMILAVVAAIFIEPRAPAKDAEYPREPDTSAIDEQLRQMREANIKKWAVQDVEMAISIANTCCSLAGKAEACGIDTEALMKSCGQKIRELTFDKDQGRDAAMRQCQISGGMSLRFQRAGGNESCSSIRAAVSSAIQ